MKFLNCKIDYSKKVLQPRIETEFWVEKAIREMGEKSAAVKVLDIFAGTGCIGIAVLKNINSSKVDFADMSEEAIRQTAINLKLNKISAGRYGIYQSDIFRKIKGKYDYIFANPPYVALDKIKEVQKEVLENEPLIALFAGKTGMVYIEKFLKEAKKHLNKNGKIFMEFDPRQRKFIKEILENRDYEFAFKKDQFRKYRWVIIH